VLPPHGVVDHPPAPTPFGVGLPRLALAHAATCSARRERGRVLPGALPEPFNWIFAVGTW
jgi:hypothetical protein